MHIIWINNLVLFFFFHLDRLNITSHNFGWQGIHISQDRGKSDQRKNPPENQTPQACKNEKYLTTIQEPTGVIIFGLYVCVWESMSVQL